MIESTGEIPTIEQRERVAIRALRAELICIEQHLLLFGEKRSARFCYLAYWELTEAPEKRQDQLYDELLQENKSLLEQAAEEAELAEVQKASAIGRLYLERLAANSDEIDRLTAWDAVLCARRVGT